ncbi:MAG: hypothetical protein JSS49_05605 [Planctomycetes bacterium]|nr:hypothetical protein [Planctomycetota bacterium]
MLIQMKTKTPDIFDKKRGRRPSTPLILESQRDSGAARDKTGPATGLPPLLIRLLPDNLLDALRAFDASPVLRTGLGDEFASAYSKLKRAQWRDYAAHVSAWSWQTRSIVDSRRQLPSLPRSSRCWTMASLSRYSSWSAS